MKQYNIMLIVFVLITTSIFGQETEMNNDKENNMNNKIIVAAAQLTPVFLNKEKTVDKACDAIAEAGKNGAKLIVFPEAFISGYPDWVWLYPPYKSKELGYLYVKLVKNAVSIPDNSTDRLCERQG